MPAYSLRIIIEGPPGSGKTEIARMVKDMLEASNYPKALGYSEIFIVEEWRKGKHLPKAGQIVIKCEQASEFK